MNIFSALTERLHSMGLSSYSSAYLILLTCLIFVISVTWRPYVRWTDRLLVQRRQRELEAELRLEQSSRARKDAARAAELRVLLEERETLERLRAEAAAAMEVFEAEQVRLSRESARADQEYKAIQQRLAESRPEFERAMQMGHEVIAIRARDAAILEAGGVPPPFRVTQVTRAVDQQLLDHRRTGRPITQPAFVEYAGQGVMH